MTFTFWPSHTLTAGSTGGLLMCFETKLGRNLSSCVAMRFIWFVAFSSKHCIVPVGSVLVLDLIK